MYHQETIDQLSFGAGAQGTAWSAVFAIFILYWLSFIPRIWMGAFKRDAESNDVKVKQT